MSDSVLSTTEQLAEDERATEEAGFGMFVGGAAAFADAETREILNLLGDAEAGGVCCGGTCCTVDAASAE